MESEKSRPAAAESVYAEICPDSLGDEDDIEFDETSQTWTVKSNYGADTPLPGIPNKAMALAIARLIGAAYTRGCREY